MGKKATRNENAELHPQQICGAIPITEPANDMALPQDRPKGLSGDDPHVAVSRLPAIHTKHARYRENTPSPVFVSLLITVTLIEQTTRFGCINHNEECHESADHIGSGIFIDDGCKRCCEGFRQLRFRGTANGCLRTDWSGRVYLSPKTVGVHPVRQGYCGRNGTGQGGCHEADRGGRIHLFFQPERWRRRRMCCGQRSCKSLQPANKPLMAQEG